MRRAERHSRLLLAWDDSVLPIAKLDGSQKRRRGRYKIVKPCNKLLVFLCQKTAFRYQLSQRRFWILDQLHPGIAAYHIPVCLRLTGPLAFDALERSLGGIVVRIGARIS